MLTRTELLMLAFGWQGGTVHQICEVVGLDTTDFLYSVVALSGLDYSRGWFCYRTNSLEFIKEKNVIEREKGNLEFWLGVVDAVDTTIKLGEQPIKKF